LAAKESVMDRRDFLANAGLLAAWAAIPIVLTGCGSDRKSPTNTEAGDVAGSVSLSNGHTHSAVITKAQIDAGSGVTLTLTGSGHTHTVSLVDEEVMSIGKGQRVSKLSSTREAHDHTVTFN
jgi:hypothetical protein